MDVCAAKENLIKNSKIHFKKHVGPYHSCSKRGATLARIRGDAVPA